MGCDSSESGSKTLKMGPKILKILRDYTSANSVYKWHFNSGPDQGQWMYDHSNDRCYGYCPWTIDEPNGDPGRTYLSTTTLAEWPNKIFFSTIRKTDRRPFICEYTDPNYIYVPYQLSTANSINLYRIPGFTTIENFTISNQITSFQCINVIEPQWSNRYTCILPSTESLKSFKYYKFIYGSVHNSLIIDYASKFMLSGTYGHLQGVFDADFADFVQTTISNTFIAADVPTTFNEFWLNIENPTTDPNNSFVISGPDYGSYLAPYYKGVFPANPTNGYGYILNMTSLSLSLLYNGGLASCIIEFGGEKTDAMKTYTFSIQGAFYGNDHHFTFRGQRLPATSSPDDLSNVMVQIGPGVGGPHTLKYFSGPDSTLALNSPDLWYKSPFITSIEPIGANYLGGLLTVHGENFGLSYDLISVRVNGDICQPIDTNSMVSDISPYVCLAPAYTAGPRALVVATVGGVDTPIFFSYYDNLPVIDTATPLPFGSPGNVTIHGYNFADNITALSIGMLNCTRFGFIDGRRVECEWPANVTWGERSTVGLNIKITFVYELIIHGSVFFYDPQTPCPNNCSANGYCNQLVSTCTCFTGWGGYNCSQSTQPPDLMPDIQPDAFITSFNERDSQFLFSLHMVVIRGAPDAVALNYTLDIGNWVMIDSDHSDAKYLYMPMAKFGLLLSVSLNYSSIPISYTFSGQPWTASPYTVNYAVKLNTTLLSDGDLSFDIIFRNEWRQTPSKPTPKGCQAQGNGITYIDNEQAVNQLEIQNNDVIYTARFTHYNLLADSYNHIYFVPSIQVMQETVDPLQPGNHVQLINVSYLTLLEPLFKMYVNIGIQIQSPFNCQESSSDSDLPDKWKLPVLIIGIIVAALFLVSEIDKILSDCQATLGNGSCSGTVWGIVVDQYNPNTETMENLYSNNPLTTLVPASNTKLLTTSTAFLELGPSFTFNTKFYTDGPFTPGHPVQTLCVKAVGDPSITSGDLIMAAEYLGKSQFISNLVLDISAYSDESAPSGWEWEDLNAAYGALPTPMIVNENVIMIFVHPGEGQGQPATVTFNDDNDATLLTIVNTATTGAPASPNTVSFTYKLASSSLYITGSIPSNVPLPNIYNVPIMDPSAYFLGAFSLLIEQSTGSTPTTSIGICDDSMYEAYVLTSMSLVDMLNWTLQTSDNLYAESFLRTLGSQVSQDHSSTPTYIKGLNLIQTVLANRSIDKHLYDQDDGCGLSRINYITPTALIKVVETMFMNDNDTNKDYISLLPTAGETGTLQDRFINTAAEGIVHAKTGTMMGINSLTGVITPHGLKSTTSPIFFSVIVNNGDVYTDPYRQAILDQIVVLLATEAISSN
eukprot:gene17381-20737_t